MRKKSNGACQQSTYSRIEVETGRQGIEQLPDRLARYAKAHGRADQMASYLREISQGEHDREAVELRRRGALLSQCGSYLQFRHYFTVDQVRLHAAKFCQQDKLCPFCAIRRGAKLLRKYSERVTYLHATRPGLVPCMSTFTVKNGSDLGERVRHLVKCYSALMTRGKNRRNLAGRAWSEAAIVCGSVASVEVKRGEGSGEWHPHIHAAWLCEGRLPGDHTLSREWKEITGDSHQLDVRPFHFVEQQLPATIDNVASDFVEVFKYALKFSSMDLGDNLHAFQVLRGRHMIFPRGALYGIEIPDDLTDDEPLELEDLPFVELIFRYSGGQYR